MIEFRRVNLDKDRGFVQEMFLSRAFESAPDATKRAGVNRFREAWLEAPAATTLMQVLESSLEDPQTITEVLTVDGQDAGLIWVTASSEPGEPPFAELRLIALHLKYQRQGLGRIAVQHVEELLLQQGIDTLRSIGHAPSEGIRHFHASLGFEPVQTVFEKRLQKRP